MRKKLPNLAHVKFVRSKAGKAYAYFNTGKKVDGKIVYTKMPDFGSEGFYPSYAALCGARTKRANPERTVKVLIDEYMGSTEFAALSPSSQRIYRINLSKVEQHLGKFPINDVLASDVRDALDVGAWGPAVQNGVIAVIGAMYTWGRRRSKAEIEPVKDFTQQKTGSHKAWPEDALEAGLVAPEDLTRLGISLLYFTGQRIGDVCAMRWGNIRNGVITITQQKTGKTVTFPLLPELKALLDATPKRGITIITHPNGKAMREEYLRLRIQAFARPYGEKLNPHGLRKNAVNALLEEGCTIAEVASVTGQTFAVVEHYAAQMNVKKLGATAMLKFDASRKRRT